MKYILLFFLFSAQSAMAQRDEPDEDLSRSETEEDVSPTFNVFPNPAHGSVQVVGNREIDRIKVYDLTGQVVHETTDPDVLNVSGWHPALYLLELNMPDGTKKVEHLYVE